MPRDTVTCPGCPTVKDQLPEMSASVAPNRHRASVGVKVDDGERLGRARERRRVHVGNPVRATETRVRRDVVHDRRVRHVRIDDHLIRRGEWRGKAAQIGRHGGEIVDAVAQLSCRVIVSPGVVEQGDRLSDRRTIVVEGDDVIGRRRAEEGDVRAVRYAIAAADPVVGGDTGDDGTANTVTEPGRTVGLAVAGVLGSARRATPRRRTPRWVEWSL